MRSPWSALTYIDGNACWWIKLISRNRVCYFVFVMFKYLIFYFSSRPFLDKLNFVTIINKTIIRTITILHQNNRLRVLLHSVRDIISHIQPVGVVVNLLIISKRRHVHHVDTLRRRWDNTIGHKKLRVVVLKVLDVCDTWRLWLVNLRMDSEKVHKQKSKLTRSN